MTIWQTIETVPLGGECYIFADWRVADGFQEVLLYDADKKRLVHKDNIGVSYSLEFFTHWANILEPPDD